MSSSRVRGVALWALPIIGSSLITLLVKQWWDAPRPHIELTSLEVNSPEETNAPILLGADLDNRIRNHAYFPNLELESPYSDVSEAIAEAKRQTDLADRSAKHLENLISLLKTQSAALALATRRREFLQAYVDRDREQVFIEFYGLEAIAEANLPEKYATHPVDSRRLTIKLNRSVYNLEEIDESQVARRAEEANPNDPNAVAIATAKAQRVNRWRRLFVYYEPDVIVPFLAGVRDQIKTSAQSAKVLTSELNVIVASAREPRLFAKALVSNVGTRPLVLRRVAVMRLFVPEGDSKEASIVNVEAVSSQESGNVTVINGGMSSTLVLQSAKVLSEIITDSAANLGGENWAPTNDLDTSRLMLLWRAKQSGLRASVVLARGGCEPGKEKAGEEEPLPKGRYK
jgi:hypothetical protein